MVDSKQPSAKPAETVTGKNPADGEDRPTRPRPVKQKKPSRGDAIGEIGDEVGGPA